MLELLHLQELLLSDQLPGTRQLVQGLGLACGTCFTFSLRGCELRLVCPCGLLLQLEDEMLFHLVYFLVKFVVLLNFIHRLSSVPLREVLINWELLWLYSLLVQMLPSDQFCLDIEL